MSLHLSTDAAAAGRIALLTQQGWRVVELAGAHDPKGFHDQIAAVLGFPDYYGRNLDALWDCLTDLAEPTAVVWRNWQRIAVHFPSWWGQAMPVLRDWAQGDDAELVLTLSAG